MPSDQIGRAHATAWKAIRLHVVHLRKEHSMGMRQIAKRCGLTVPQVSQILAATPKEDSHD